MSDKDSAALTLEANDVWFFRTSRPFGSAQAASSAGEADLLPSPGVVFGAIRTALGEALGIDWEAYANDWKTAGQAGALLGPPEGDSTNGVNLAGVLPARFDGDAPPQPLFPLPSFVLAPKKTGDTVESITLQLAQPRKAAGGFSSGMSNGLQPVLADPTDRDGKEFVGTHCAHLASQGDFAKVLQGGKPTGKLIPQARLAEIEPRIGIARDTRSRTVHQGDLYVIETHRWNAGAKFKECERFGLLARVTNIDPKELRKAAPLVHLGGERRLAWASARDDRGWLTGEQHEAIRTKIGETRRWFLTLAAPAWFADGWRPRWVAKENDGYVARLRDGKAGEIHCGRLVGYTSESPRIISGWDYARKRPKPTRRLLPAGATWFFELAGDPDPAALDEIVKLQGTCIADDQPHAGFGLAFAGAWSGNGTDTTASPSR